MALNIYNDIATCVNKTCVRILVDSSYERYIDPYYTENNIAPIYEIEGEECLSLVPIREMLEMIHDGVPFTIVTPKDIPDVVTIVSHYLQTMDTFKVDENSETTPEEVAETIKLCKEGLPTLLQLLDQEKILHPERPGNRTLLDVIPKNIDKDKVTYEQKTSE